VPAGDLQSENTLIKFEGTFEIIDPHAGMQEFTDDHRGTYLFAPHVRRDTFYFGCTAGI